MGQCQQLTILWRVAVGEYAGELSRRETLLDKAGFLTLDALKPPIPASELAVTLLKSGHSTGQLIVADDAMQRLYLILIAPKMTLLSYYRVLGN